MVIRFGRTGYWHAFPPSVAASLSAASIPPLVTASCTALSKSAYVLARVKPVGAGSFVVPVLTAVTPTDGASSLARQQLSSMQAVHSLAPGPEHSRCRTNHGIHRRTAQMPWFCAGGNHHHHSIALQHNLSNLNHRQRHPANVGCTDARTRHVACMVAGASPVGAVSIALALSLEQLLALLALSFLPGLPLLRWRCAGASSRRQG